MASVPGTPKSRPRTPCRSKTIFVSYVDSAEANVHNVETLKKLLHRRGYRILEHRGQVFNTKRINELDDETKENLAESTAMVVCVSREYHRNKQCKLLARYATGMINRGSRGASFEVMYVMLQGDYTMVSQPHSVSGWLRYLIRDCLWYPAWSGVHLSGASEAINGVISLLNHAVDIDDAQMRAWKEDIEKLGDPKSPKRGDFNPGGRSRSPSPITTRASSAASMSPAGGQSRKQHS